MAFDGVRQWWGAVFAVVHNSIIHSYSQSVHAFKIIFNICEKPLAHKKTLHNSKYQVLWENMP